MNLLPNLSPHLFWDIDFSQLDWNKHQLLIVERVIERGTYKEFRLVESHYGKKEMTRIIKNLSYLHIKDIAFVHTYFDIPLNELKCYTRKQLNQNFWN